MKVSNKCVVCNSTDVSISTAILAPFVAERIFNWQPVQLAAGDNTIVVAYPVCNSIACRECGFIFCDMRFDDEELSNLYINYRDETYTAIREKHEPNYRELNAICSGGVSYIPEVEQFIGIIPRNVLDWGGNDGTNTPFKDAQIHIYDIGAVVPKFGVKVDVPLPPYDLIVCCSVLEHVSYPRDILTEIKKTMDSNTLLYVEVPLEGADSHIWHEHINIFNESSLSRLLVECGFEIVAEKSIPAPDFPSVKMRMVVCRA